MNEHRLYIFSPHARPPPSLQSWRPRLLRLRCGGRGLLPAAARPEPGSRGSHPRTAGLGTCSRRWPRTPSCSATVGGTARVSVPRVTCPACCCDHCLVACCMILYSTVSKQTFINTAPSRGHPLHLPLVSVPQYRYRALLSLQL